MHPYCRSTTICDIGEDELARMARRARNPETGRTETVPASMTYKQWYDEKVRGHPDAELNEKKIKHQSADKKQYQRYKDVLEDDAPKTLDDFQNMKYTEPEKWEKLKKKRSIFSEIADKEWTYEFKEKARNSYRKFEKEGFTLSSHALSRLPRLNKKGFPNVSEKDVLSILKQKAQYTEGEEKEVFFDEGKQLSIVKNRNTGDIVTIVRRKHRKEEWEDV